MDLMPDPRQLLQSEATVSLAAWYAAPLSQAAAMELQTQARQMTKHVLACGELSLAPRLAEMIAGFWQGRDVTHDHRSLIATWPETQQAAVELIYGQLLMSCKRIGAMQHLDRGFQLATPALAPAAYFILLRRHTLLRNLELTAAGSPSQSLPNLLLEARVIQRLRGGGGRIGHPHNSHEDTLG